MVVETKKHADLGAANSGRWIPCPGSARAIKAANIVEKPNKYAAEGTVAHEIASELLDLIFTGTAIDLETPRTVDGFTFEISDEMQTAVQVYVDFIVGEVARHKLDPLRHIFVESKVELPGLDLDGTQRFGRVDCALHVPYTKLMVIDYKHGVGVGVDAEANYQAMNYALGILDYIGDDADIPEVEIVIVQPRRPGHSGIERFTLSVAELEAFRPVLLAAVTEAHRPDAELVAGGHCHKYFCPVKAICPAARAHAGKLMELDFADYKPQALPAVTELSVEKMAEILDGKEYVESWFKAIAGHLTHLLETGKDVPGYHLEQKWGNRKWTDEEGLEATLNDALYDLPKVMAELLTEPKMKSVAQAEKVLKKAKVNIDLSKFIDRPDNGLALTKGDGKGITTAEHDFIDV